MSLCINPNCSNPNHPGNARHRHCQSCNADLVIHKRYRVSRLLSDSTGFGKIYEASDRGKPRILKILKIDDPKAIALFKQEAEVLGQLNHPGIPKIDTYFTWYPQRFAKPLHCLVMEKIQGHNLQTWMQGKPPISYEQALDWLNQLIEILDCVHQKQYFHRDIKPANIMRRPDGRLTLIDFGTAREMTHTYLAKMGSGSGVTSIASAGYTPLEQNNGKAVPQSDFYALGRTFVFLLTGKSPTAFDEDPRTGELMWREDLPNLPPPFVDLIDRMMAPFPGNRPPNTEAIATQLQALETEVRHPQSHLNEKVNPAQTAATVPLFAQQSRSPTAVGAADVSVSLDTPSIPLEVTLPTIPTFFKQISPQWWAIAGATAIAIAVAASSGAAYWVAIQRERASLQSLDDALPEFSFELPPEPSLLPKPAPTPPLVSEPIPLSLQAQHGGVTLAVAQLHEDPHQYILDIALTNNSARSVEFLSSFFKLTNDSGLAVSATVENIPETLANNGKTATGQLKIPSGLLIGSQSIALTVTDSEETIKLTIPNIPLTAPSRPVTEESPSAAAEGELSASPAEILTPPPAN
jgi:serine/threonine protein kinase